MELGGGNAQKLSNLLAWWKSFEAKRFHGKTEGNLSNFNRSWLYESVPAPSRQLAEKGLICLQVNECRHCGCR
jgi:hypothetical protein